MSDINESLMNFDASATTEKAPALPATTPPADTVPEGTAAPARVIEYNGEKVEVPENYWDPVANAPNVGALAKSVGDLRRQVSSLPKAPGEYQITVPKDLAAVVDFNADDPRWKMAVEWGKANNIPAETMQGLVEIELRNFAQSQISTEQRGKEEAAALDKALGTDAPKEKENIHRFTVNLLGDKLKDPAIVSALSSLTSTAAGVMVLKHIKDAVAQGGKLPMPGGDTSGGIPISEEFLRKLQASDAYLKGDPATVRQVTEGYKRLYDREG